MATELVLCALPNTEEARSMVQKNNELIREYDTFIDKLGDVVSRSQYEEICLQLDTNVDEYAVNCDRLYGNALGSVTIGECSYSKAEMNGDHERFIPLAVHNVARIVSEGQVVVNDKRTMKAIMVAMNVKNTSWYSKSGWGFEGMNSRRNVKRFLEAHQGELLYATLA